MTTNPIQANTLKFLKDRIGSHEKDEYNSHFNEGQALALAYLNTVVADHRVPGQGVLLGVEGPSDPETPNFGDHEGIAFVGKDHDDEQLVIVHDWTTQIALDLLREATLWFYANKKERLCSDLYCLLEEARTELGDAVNLGDDTPDDADFVAGPLGLPIGECVFSDGYDTCHRCSKIIRTSADSRFWQAEYYINDNSEIICGVCVRTNNSEKIAYLAYLEGHPGQVAKENSLLEKS